MAGPDLARYRHSGTDPSGPCEPRNQVGRPRSAGGHAHSNASRSPALAVGSVGGRLFVAGQHVS